MKIFDNKFVVKNADEFVKKFTEELLENNFYNKLGETFKLKIKPTEYGYKGNITCAPGLCFDDLRDKLGIISNSLESLITIDYKHNSNYGDIKIITKENAFDLSNLTIPKVQSNEFFIGFNVEKEPVTIDFNKNCMCLMDAVVGAGKTRLLMNAMIAWCMSCNENEVNIFVNSTKSEFTIFSLNTKIKSHFLRSGFYHYLKKGLV